MEVILTNRLKDAVSLLPKGLRVADVGTDHGYAAAWLIQKGIAPYVIASDLRKGPLESAARTCRDTGVGEQVELRLSDGLKRIARDEVDSILIAGMGGETIHQILEASPWALEKIMVLQPQSKEEELLTYLQEKGCAVTPKLSREGKRYYLIYAVKPGAKQQGDVRALLLAEKDPLLYGYAMQEVEKLTRAEQGAKGGRDDSAARILGEKIARWESIMQEAKAYDQDT